MYYQNGKIILGTRAKLKAAQIMVLPSQQFWKKKHEISRERNRSCILYARKLVILQLNARKNRPRHQGK